MSDAVRVFCRVRPPSEDVTAFSYSEKSIDVEVPAKQQFGKQEMDRRMFECTGVFPPSARQDDVWDGLELDDAVDKALNGYQTTVFAYGQTGSGKTYTMEGGMGEEGEATKKVCSPQKLRV